MNQKTTRFNSWFDTPYYHILYRDRDAREAEFFMANLVEFLSLKKDSHILDIPCGRGRHSVFLNSLGFCVTGKDLSNNSIKFAKQFENERLHFEIADICKPFPNKYDAIFNLFTSFGYFEQDSKNIQILKNIKNALKQNAIAVIDFLNADKVKHTLVKKETKTIEGIEFKISRKIENSLIIKDINFIDDGKSHNYRETIKYLNFDKMKTYLDKAGLKLLHTFGNYHLAPFCQQTSERLILVVR